MSAYPAYYNEHDSFAAEWLRELIKASLIAPGDVDERDVRDLLPIELMGYAQVHLFGGIGVWSHALRLAGWPDTRPVWTVSCPCQPFSTAGQGAGFADERHLWPAAFHLISECRPPVIFGEQVASKDGLLWLDLVQADLEGADYACGAVDTCAAGFGAPHIRQRLYFVAHTIGAERGRRTGRGAGLLLHTAERGAASLMADAALRDGWSGKRGAEAGVGSDGIRGRGFTGGGITGLVGHALCPRLEGHGELEAPHGRGDGVRAAPGPVGAAGAACGLADAERQRLRGEECGEAFGAPSGVQGADGQRERLRSDAGAGRATLADPQSPAGPTNGFWRTADWLFCTDGKWRPVRPGTFPLATGAPNRVGRLRGAGNSIVAEQAAAFVSAYLDLMEGEGPRP